MNEVYSLLKPKSVIVHTWKNPSNLGLLDPQRSQRWAPLQTWYLLLPSTVPRCCHSHTSSEACSVSCAWLGPGCCPERSCCTTPVPQNSFLCPSKSLPLPISAPAPHEPVWMDMDYTVNAICIPSFFFKAQWFGLTNVFRFTNMFSSHLCPFSIGIILFTSSGKNNQQLEGIFCFRFLRRITIYFPSFSFWEMHCALHSPHWHHPVVPFNSVLLYPLGFCCCFCEV